jgi:GNAT superfamily N-acetyltransferase
MLGKRGRCFNLQSNDHAYVRFFKPSDSEQLRTGFAKLSPRSRYRRFFSASTRLGAAQLEALTSVDEVNHVALCAGVIGGPTWEGAGIARFIRPEPEASEAEVALTVIDKYQGRGLGTLLFQLLVQEAWERGITHFTGQLLPDNQLMLRILRRFSIESELLAGPVLSFRMPLAAMAVGARDVSAQHEGILYAPVGPAPVPTTTRTAGA